MNALHRDKGVLSSLHATRMMRARNEGIVESLDPTSSDARPENQRAGAANDGSIGEFA